MNEEVAQFDPRPERAAPEVQHAVAASKAPEHRSLVRQLLQAVGHADAEERAVRLGGGAMNPLVVEGYVHAAARDGTSADLDLRSLRQRQRLAECAKSSDRMKPDGQARRALIKAIGRHDPAAQLGDVSVAGATASLVAWTLLAALGAIVQRQDVQRRRVDFLAGWWPVLIRVAD